MIRPLTPADTPALLELAAGTGVFKPFEIEVLREVLDDYHAGRSGPDHVAICSERDGGVPGFAYYAPDIMTEQSWYLYWIAVSKQEQARGIGSELMRYVENDIRNRNGRMLFIETSSLPHSELTRRFYLKMGYEITAEVRDFYADGDHQVIFRKRVSRSA